MAEGLRGVVIPYRYTTTPCSRLVKPMSINKEVCARDPSTQDDVMNYLVVLEYRNSIRQTSPSNLIVPMLRSPTRLSQLMPWVIPLFTKLGYSKHRERIVQLI